MDELFFENLCGFSKKAGLKGQSPDRQQEQHLLAHRWRAALWLIADGKQTTGNLDRDGVRHDDLCILRLGQHSKRDRRRSTLRNQPKLQHPAGQGAACLPLEL